MQAGALGLMQTLDLPTLSSYHAHCLTFFFLLTPFPNLSLWVNAAQMWELELWGWTQRTLSMCGRLCVQKCAHRTDKDKERTGKWRACEKLCLASWRTFNFTLLTVQWITQLCGSSSSWVQTNLNPWINPRLFPLNVHSWQCSCFLRGHRDIQYVMLSLAIEMLGQAHCTLHSPS